MPEANFLEEKGEGFLADAKYDISQKRWFLTAFHLEQTCQLYLKHALFKELGDFPKLIKKIMRTLIDFLREKIF